MRLCVATRLFFWAVALVDLPASVDSQSGVGGARPGMTQEQYVIFCHLKQAAGERFHTNPELPMAESCAVVSHSGGLLFHRLGEDIDNHDRIIRFNANPVKGYESHVGCRTDIRFGTFAGLNDSEVGDAIVCDEVGRKQPCVDYGRPILHVRGPTADCDTTFPKIMSLLYPSRAGQQTTPANELTSGFDGMMVALTSCRRVDAYEITPSDIAAKCGSYAYEGNHFGEQADENKWHGYFDAEHDLWARLSVDRDLRRSQGKTSYLGFSSVTCPEILPPLLSVEANLVAPNDDRVHLSCEAPEPVAASCKKRLPPKAEVNVTSPPTKPAVRNQAKGISWADGGALFPGHSALRPWHFLGAGCWALALTFCWLLLCRRPQGYFVPGYEEAMCAEEVICSEATARPLVMAMGGERENSLGRLPNMPFPKVEPPYIDAATAALARSRYSRYCGYNCMC